MVMGVGRAGEASINRRDWRCIEFLGQSGKLAYRCVLFGVASPIVLCVLGYSRSTLGSSDVAGLTPVSALEKIKLRDADRLHILEISLLFLGKLYGNQKD